MSRFAMLGLLIALTTSAWAAHAQQPAFVAIVNRASLTAQQNETLSGIKSLPTTREATVVRLNIDALRNSDEISVPLDSKLVSIQKNFRQSQGGNTIWSGAAPHELNGSTTIVANEQNVTGSIQTEDGSYRIWPLGDGLHALVKLNTKKLPPEHPPSSE